MDSKDNVVDIAEFRLLAEDANPVEEEDEFGDEEDEDDDEEDDDEEDDEEGDEDEE